MCFWAISWFSPSRISTGSISSGILAEGPMLRKAFLMKVNPGMEAEYEKRHSPIWPELKAVLKKHGVSNYSIFLHPETRQLFAYAEVSSEKLWNAIASTETCRKWWASMKDLMPSNPDNSPVSLDLKEVFHLD
jgi:L-rhamnose mutarotase